MIYITRQTKEEQALAKVVDNLVRAVEEQMIKNNKREGGVKTWGKY